ncbi:hypothetical protein F4680DRAFT_369296 [Xylaria scruposa]|nr:hypothetical protein F4680DRAFT_369296 [Xylaria scruposa]
MPKRPFSGRHSTPQKIRRHSNSSHLTPVMRVTRPIPVDARPHIEYLSRFSLAQVTKWIELCQGSQPISTDAEVEVDLAVKPESLPVAITQKPEKNSAEENSGIYSCTFCDRAYKKRGSWIRHEASLHEPQQEWICSSVGCNRRFSDSTRFRRHHKEDHGCVNCTHSNDPSYLVGPSAKPSWGCGFCIAFLESWEARYEHLANHFEEGSKKAEWDQSKVIQGLLLRPSVNDAWKSLMSKEYGLLEKKWPIPGWSRDSFGKLLAILRHDMSQESAVEAAQLTYNMLLPTNLKDKHLSEVANDSSGDSFLATDESTLTSDGFEQLFNWESMQSFYLGRDDAAAEAAFQLSEGTIGVDWVLRSTCFESGGIR